MLPLHRSPWTRQGSAPWPSSQAPARSSRVSIPTRGRPSRTYWARSRRSRKKLPQLPCQPLAWGPEPIQLSVGQPKLPGRSPSRHGRARLRRCSCASAAPSRCQVPGAAEPMASQGSTSTATPSTSPRARGWGTVRPLPSAATASAARPSASASSRGKAEARLVLAKRRPPAPPSTARHQALWMLPPPTACWPCNRTPSRSSSQCGGTAGVERIGPRASESSLAQRARGVAGTTALRPGLPACADGRHR